MSLNTIKTVNTIKTFYARSSQQALITTTSPFKILTAITCNRSASSPNKVTIYKNAIDANNLLLQKSIPPNSDMVVLAELIGVIFESGTYFMFNTGTYFDESEVVITIGIFD